MPRVHRRKARKDYPAEGIAKGDVYYSWKFRNTPVCRSLNAPLPEQLTQSACQQEWIPLNREVTEFDGSADDLKELAERFRTLGSDQEERRDNMPDSLQESPSAELLSERASECEEVADELDEFATRLEEEDGEAAEGIVDEVRQAAR